MRNEEYKGLLKIEKKLTGTDKVKTKTVEKRKKGGEIGQKKAKFSFKLKK